MTEPHLKLIDKTIGVAIVAAAAALFVTPVMLMLISGFGWSALSRHGVADPTFGIPSVPTRPLTSEPATLLSRRRHRPSASEAVTCDKT